MKRLTTLIFVGGLSALTTLSSSQAAQPDKSNNDTTDRHLPKIRQDAAP